jgi:hypothetical protein
MYAIIEEYLANIEVFKLERNKQTGQLNVINYNKVVIYFNRIGEIEIFKEDILELKSHETFFYSDMDIFSIDESTFNQVNAVIQKINRKISLFKDIYNSFMKEQDPLTISFKLYEFEHFSDYVDFCNDLNNKIFNPLNRLKVSVALGELEAGSKWISIVCGSLLGVTLLTGIVRASFDILIHDYQKYRVTEDLIQSLSMERQFIEEFQKKKETQQKEELITKATEIVNSNQLIDKKGNLVQIEESEKQELINSTIMAINIMKKHIDKGLEVYQALDIPNDKRFELPKYSDLIAAKQKPKEIEQK